MVMASRCSSPRGGHHFAVELDADVRNRAHLLDQVLRHAFLEPVGANEERHLTGKAREVHRRLAGGVGPTDDVHVLARDVLGFGERGAVIDASAGQLSRPGAFRRR